MHEKGRTTQELSGAAITYTSSKPSVTEVDQTGKIITKHAGVTYINVKLALDGVTVEAEQIKLQVSGKPVLHRTKHYN